ncbi:MAG: hypothetical protein ACE5IZ_04260 [Dehalococcoidia bacterium]
MEESKVRPALQAFVLCERVETAQDGVHSLIRVFDRSVINVQATGPLPPEGIAIEQEFSVFARWGNGVGHFQQYIELENPSEEKFQTPENIFWLVSRSAIQNVMTRVRIVVKESGRYLLRLFLDGEKISEIVWTVEFNVREVRPPA